MKRLILCVAILTAIPTQPSFAHEHAKPVKASVYYEPHNLGVGIYMLQAHHFDKKNKKSTGSNVAVSIGTDGTLVVDSQFSKNVDSLLNAIRELSDQPIGFLVNTHFHADHSGGNDKFSDTGAKIIAHNYARKRMLEAAKTRKNFPVSSKGLPIVTFSKTMTFHWNDHSIQAVHLQAGHTDGDVIIKFTDANVIHTGDAFFSRRYPYIDVDAGGQFLGYLDNLQVIHDMADDETRIIPGHGPVMHRKDLLEVKADLTIVHERILTAIRNGQSFESTLAQSPLSDFNSIYGQWGITEEKVIHAIYKEAGKL